MYSYNSRVRYSETGINGTLSLEAILDYFQDCSTFHSEDVGMGIRNLEKKRRIWVLSAWQIVVGRYPEYGERIKIVTFPYDFKGFMGYRNFYIEDEWGRKAAYANSVWSLMDLDSMKPAKVSEDMSCRYELSEKLPMNYAPRKIVIPEDSIQKEAFKIKPHHLDTNHHVNNGRYLEMAIDYLPSDIIFSQMRAEYKKPALLQDVVIPFVSCQNGKYTISLCQEGGQPFAVVELQGKQEWCEHEQQIGIRQDTGIKGYQEC